MSDIRSTGSAPPSAPAGVHRHAYLLFMLPALLPPTAWALAHHDGRWDVWAWYVPFIYFVAIPVVDRLLGRDRRNPSPEQEAALKNDPYYVALPLLCVPLQLGVLLWGAWVFADAPFGWVGQLGWMVSIGCVGGVLAINTAHELIHKATRMERGAGGVLLASVLYGSFKIEHIYGHHVDVATPADNSTARRGESAYHFIARAFAHNVSKAWALERANAARLGKPFVWWRSEVVAWFGLSALLALACWVLAGGWHGVLYFAVQAVVAIALLETINYIEHYGLQRRRLPNGRYERVDPTHSWNADFLLTNLLLFQLQRHSDHHAHAARRYHLLRHCDEAPQLPYGYATMMVLAWVPPLWRRVMDPRVDRYQSALPQAR
nr:alkane 1-monooxygenase [uncultured Caldimonas sp.]